MKELGLMVQVTMIAGFILLSGVFLSAIGAVCYAMYKLVDSLL